MIFITLGSRPKPFLRMLNIINQIKNEDLILQGKNQDFLFDGHSKIKTFE